jgi:arsenite methyltransferase
MIALQNDEQIKLTVRAKYAEIALQSKETNSQSCCGSGPQGTYNIMSDSYDALKGYNPDADLGLGCGLPTAFAYIQTGDTVLDLGSGAGNDCFVARAETGAEGKVLGVDFTPEMIRKARENAERLGYNNVEFREGDIENLPVSDNSVDVIVSNCVLNLVPNKPAVFGQIMRVLKPGGHFSISDVVLLGDLPDTLRESAEMYAGCVAGAIQMDEYLGIIYNAGFQNVTIQKQKPILIPDNILRSYLSEEEIRSFMNTGTGIFSITVYAQKPGEQQTKPKVNLANLSKLSKGCNPASGCC